ncbi:MAG: FAD-binding oxidoreductase [Actinomycetota bacterium]|nr:FAD-binding oxidoreductase [Actinomycetota bacterium]
MARSARSLPAYDAFANRFSGTLLHPDDAAYEEARTLHNAMIETRPALVAQCANPADITAAISFGLDAGFELAVRAGGHSVAGMSSTEGVVIDVRPMKEITITPGTRTARVGAGVTWGEFDRAAQEHGLATTGGRVSTTGVAGFALGGGSGWIERKYGLTCDNLRAVEFVLANGDHVRASAEENTDLFWASRGGGGNFGVATAFEFDMHPIGPIVHAGLMLWPAASGPDVAHAFRDFAEAAPEDFGSGLVNLTGPPEEFVPPELQGQLLCALAICYFGPLDQGEALLAPLRALSPAVDLVQPMPYADFQCMIDDPPGLRNYWSASYLTGLPDDAIATFLKASSDMRSPIAQNLLLPWGGAVSRATDADTPMAQRDATWIYHPFATWESPADDATNIAWAREAIADMNKFATDGVYLNFIGDEGADRIEAAYGASYPRLREIKRRYDPDNVFHRNQNIKP